MKVTNFALILFLMPLSALGFSDYDSCYQLYAERAVYPVICLNGSFEEGVGGARVRLTVFGVSSDRVKHCMTSTSVEFDDSKFIFEVNGIKELIFENISHTPNGLKTGDAVIGHTQLKFMELEAESVRYLQRIAIAACH